MATASVLRSEPQNRFEAAIRGEHMTLGRFFAVYVLTNKVLRENPPCCQNGDNAWARKAPEPRNGMAMSIRRDFLIPAFLSIFGWLLTACARPRLLKHRVARAKSRGHGMGCRLGSHSSVFGFVL